MAGINPTQSARFMEGRQFGRLLVLHRAEPPVRTERSRLYWLCECQCGNRVIVRGTQLRRGMTRSCGCLRDDARKGNQHARKHGLWATPEWQAWSSMRRRCYEPGTTGYERYGGRGIKVCERWRYFFEDFLADMGPRPSPKHSLDRINVDGDYEPGNCRWATSKEQNQNRRSNRSLTFNGETLLMSQWAERIGISKELLHYRLKAGWSVEQALATPVSRDAWKRRRKPEQPLC